MESPKILKDFNVLVDGTSLLGKATSFQPPSVKVETDSARYAGMDGKIKHDMGLDDMDAKLKMAELSPALAALVGNTQEVSITCYGFAESSPGGESVEHVYTMRGRFIEQNIGDIESGKKTDIDFMISCTAYKEVIAGRTTKDIDILSSRRVIGGKDMMAEKRKALKM